MMSLLSPKMTAKRPSAADTIFPPKKRALYEHMKLHGIDKFTTNGITADGILGYQENVGMYGMKIPVNIEIAQSENFSRSRSDSLHSHVSSNSDNTETGSVGSRETSPCTIQSMFDHHTPERNPITSLDGLKPDISKPLFPPSDSDNSTVGSDGHLSPDNSLYGEQEETKSDKYEREVTQIDSEGQTDLNSIPENTVETFHKNEASKNDSFQKENIPDMGHGELKENGTSCRVEQARNDEYMGPMVSLLNRFNAEAVQNNIGVKIKEQFSLEKMRNIVPSNLSTRQSAIGNYPHQQLESLDDIQNNVKTYIVTNKVNKAPIEKRYCHLCNKEFASRANLQSHMKVHENKSIPCWVCKETFQTAENLNVHMKIEHKGENPYKCEHCSREFTQFNNLRRHMRVHREKVFKCNLCNREFNEEFYLKMHMGTHTGKRVYSCGVCGASFPSSHDLKMHVKTHSPSLLHTCDVCGKSFSKACVLRQHKKGHSGERPHKCDKCEKTFIHRHHLTMHMKSHVDEKRLSCDICQKEFSQHSHLYKHLRAHEEMKKYGVDLESVQKVKNDNHASVEKKNVTKDPSIVSRPMPKVVLNTDSASLNDGEAEKSDRPVITNVFPTSGKTTKQRRRNVSQHSQLQNSRPVHTSSPSPDHNKPLPSLSQTFSHHLGRYPSMPYGQSIPHNYLPGSPAQPFSPLYNPLLRNGVPAELHGYQSYNHLYRNYSEQVQTYYNNMYMMNYLSQNALLQKTQGEGQNSQNALLQKTQGEGQNFKNGEDNQLEKLSESRNMPSLKQNPGLLQPKVIKGIESLEREKAYNEKDEKSEFENVASENEEHSDLDIVNEIDDHEKENSQDINKDIETNSKDNTVLSEEHEIAQELLKMSAGTKMIESDVGGKSVQLTKEAEIPVKDNQINGMKFTHCINDIIERTVRNCNKLPGNIHVLNSQNIANEQSNFSPFHSVSKSDEHLQVTIPKSVEQLFPVAFSTRQYGEYCSGPEESQRDLKARLTDVNKIGDCQTSPLQKLKMFVTSEEKDFNKIESEVDESRKYDSLLNSYKTDKIEQRLEAANKEDYYHEKSDQLLETGENVGKPMKSNNDEVNKVHSEAKNVDTSLEVRLEKIRQFADIGKRLGRSVNKNEIVGNRENEVTTELFEGQEDSFVDGGNEIREMENHNDEIREDNPVDVVTTVGYFDDSLEDRQLEIVENAIIRDEETGKQSQLNATEKEEESDGKLNTSASERYVFTENEFLSHISQMNDVIEENDVGNVKATEEISDENEIDRKIVDKIIVENKENLFDPVRSHKMNAGMNDSVFNTGGKQDFNKSNVENYRIGPYVKSLDENNSEYEAVDLRTEVKSDESKVSEDSHSENDASKRVEQENIPMDLSMSGKRKRESGDQIERMETNKVVGSPVSLTCGLCWRTFESVQLLESHQIEHAKNIGNTCNICKKSFTGAFELQCHMLKHRNIKTSILNKVKSYVSRKSEINENLESSLIENVKHAHSLNVIERESCEISQSEMKNERSEMGETQYCCQFCDKTFDQSEEWVEHLKTHNATDKPYTCNICRRGFTHRHNLNRHKMSHNSKSYQCNICNRSFKEVFYLQMHMKAHDEENFHKCQICGQNVRKSEIWQHTSQHLGNVSENPTYQQIGNRVQEILHEQNLNTNDNTASVNSMGKQFNVPHVTESDTRKSKFGEKSVNDRQSNEALNLKKENIENWNVQRGTKIDSYDGYNAFPVKVNTVKYVSVLAERRQECSSRNSGASGNTGKSTYECHICKTVLRTKPELDNHMGIHTGLRPHVCNTCGRAFKKSKGLRTHEKLHLEPSF
ncbi:uncharacterized protein LOC123542450 [Mercenaria mercenaria]|uniref:uncharacterized protein LOC123542450 n=1 Tax=Mercenaria mercenaria TaxID=6596 RepID=UPI00234EFECD|nr:uncharacterized protein LOC123542450 [Mercenaria mercenaria]